MSVCQAMGSRQLVTLKPCDIPCRVPFHLVGGALHPASSFCGFVFAVFAHSHGWADGYAGTRTFRREQGHFFSLVGRRQPLNSTTIFEVWGQLRSRGRPVSPPLCTGLGVVAYGDKAQMSLTLFSGTLAWTALSPYSLARPLGGSSIKNLCADQRRHSASVLNLVAYLFIYFGFWGLAQPNLVVHLAGNGKLFQNLTSMTIFPLSSIARGLPIQAKMFRRGSCSMGLLKRLQWQGGQKKGPSVQFSPG
jgi:hypothetical protein